MDNNRSDFEKTVGTEESRHSYAETSRSSMTSSEPFHPVSPREDVYRYSGEYTPYDEPKKKENTMLIVLAACLAALVAILIAVCIIFFTKFTGDSGSKNKKDDNKAAVTEIEEEETEEVDPEEKEMEKVEFVTYISDAQIFVRSGPGTNYDKLMAINGSDRSVRLEYTGTNQTGADGYTWYEVNLPSGQVGWVRSDIVIVYSGPNTPIRQSIKTNAAPSYNGSTLYLVTNQRYYSIYVRSGPGKSYSVLREIAAGDTSVRLSYNNYSRVGQDGYIWYNVTLPGGKNAWVRSDIVKWTY